VNWPNLYDMAYLEAAERVLRSQRYTQGAEQAALEAEFVRWLGVDDMHAVAVTNGTAALQAALLAHGILPGDEVIVPALTFTATGLAVKRVGAVPVFVDIDPQTLTIDVDQLNYAVTPRTKAVIAVDLDGHPAHYDALEPFCEGRGLFLLEDACPAHGSVLDGRICGTFGDAAAFSMNQTKIHGVGEGGMVVTRHAHLAVRVRALRDFGEVERRKLRVSTLMGDNWKLDEMGAAMARVSLAFLEERIRTCVENCGVLDEAMNGLHWIRRPHIRPGAYVVRHKYRARINGKREAIENEMTVAGIPVTVTDVLPLPHHPVFEHEQADVPQADLAVENTVVIGSRESPLWAVSRDAVAVWGDKLRGVETRLWSTMKGANR